MAIEGFPEVPDAPPEVDPRPEVSPYTKKLVSLSFENGQTLYVAEPILLQAPKLRPMTRQYPLSVGHVIVNFLYTGRYETLKPGGSSPESARAFEFTTVIQVLDAANHFELPLLHDLAGAELRRLGDEMELATVIATIDQSKVRLSEPTALYLDSRLRSHATSLNTGTGTSEDCVATPGTLAEVIFRSMSQSVSSTTACTCRQQIIAQQAEEAAMAEEAEAAALKAERDRAVDEEETLEYLIARTKRRVLTPDERTQLRQLIGSATSRAEILASMAADEEAETQPLSSANEPEPNEFDRTRPIFTQPLSPGAFSSPPNDELPPDDELPPHDELPLDDEQVPQDDGPVPDDPGLEDGSSCEEAPLETEPSAEGLDDFVPVTRDDALPGECQAVGGTVAGPSTESQSLVFPSPPVEAPEAASLAIPDNPEGVPFKKLSKKDLKKWKKRQEQLAFMAMPPTEEAEIEPIRPPSPKFYLPPAAPAPPAPPSFWS